MGQEAESLLDPCVQCGQCTFVCPTFRLLSDEWDGPRGRIYLIKQMLEGKMPSASSLPPAYTLKTLRRDTIEANLQQRLDRCLTCRSCEASCPHGVRYGRLLDIGRELAEKAVPRPLNERLTRGALRVVVSHRRRFTALLRIGQMLRRILPRGLRSRIPERRSMGAWPNHGHARSMLVWQGCVQPALAPDINAAAARVLDRLGIQLIAASDGCCGALSHHLAAGEARAFMRRNIDVLWPHIEAGAEALVLTASGCGAHFRDYGELLKDDPRYRDKARRISEMTKDIAEVVTDAWKEDMRVGSPPQRLQRIAFLSSCSLQHGQRLNAVAEKLLKRAGFKLVSVAYPFMCCGAAGTYAILQRRLSESLRALKLGTLMATRPEAIATANIGCLIHMAALSPVPVHHWIEFLDETFSATEGRLTAEGQPSSPVRVLSGTSMSGRMFVDIFYP
ncbi:MAG: glycolate oxidase subunit GlcF [Acidiferrobacter sp.]